MTALRPIRRVMLIFPPVFDVRYHETIIHPPMGVAALAAYVRNEVEVTILDTLAEGAYNRELINSKIELVGLPYDEIIERVRRYQPDLVGISCIYSNQFASAAELARRIKIEIAPEIVVTTGGTHPSFLPEKSMAAAPLDYVVQGEGELTFLDLIRAHNRGAGIEHLDGLAYRTNGDIKVNPKVRLIENLDDLPLPARDLLPIQLYWKINFPPVLHYRKRRNMVLYTSRGCPYLCSYCASCHHWGRKYRTRSVSSVLAEIRILRDTYGVEELKFGDDNLITPRKRAVELFQGMISEGLTMPWNAPNGVALWALDEDLVALMKKSGCYHVTLPVESGDQRMLTTIMNKPLKLEHTRKAARLVRKYGLVSTGYIILGAPGETHESIANTVRFVRELKLDYIFPFIYIPLPGSDLWQVCLDKGYVFDDVDFESANNFFHYSLNREEVSGAELEKIQRRLYLTNNVLMLPFRNPRWFFEYHTRLIRERPHFLKTIKTVLRYIFN